MKSDFPTERWFWFDPPFHPNQSTLLHRQADDVWRIDFQLGWDADPDEEKKPERILPRLRAMLGEAADFEIEWASVYTFACRRMQRFRHGRVLFAGDAAHVVSPFGARGANSGIQDTDNLVWKLDLVLRGRAPDALLDTYDFERTRAADENILHSTRATDFITPKSKVSRTFRDAVLALAKDYAFARRLVNSGRLSVPAILADSPLNTPDRDADFARGPGAMVPGAPGGRRSGRGPAGDWLLDYLGGGFTLLGFDAAVAPSDVAALAHDAIACRVVQVGGAASAAARRRMRGSTTARARGPALRRAAGTVYLLRPDQHVCARWRAFDLASVRARSPARRATLRLLTRQPMATLITESNHPAPDDFYERLIATHRGLVRRGERPRQREARPAARQSHRRRRGARAGDGGRARGRRRHARPRGSGMMFGIDLRHPMRR